MKRIILALLPIAAAGLLLVPGIRADDVVYPKVEGLKAQQADGSHFPKVEISINDRARSEALAIGRRIRIDLSKVEGEVAGKGKLQPAGRQSPKMGAPEGSGRTVKGRAGSGNIVRYTESLLRETEKLSRLHAREGLNQGSTRYSAPMNRDAMRLHSLAGRLDGAEPVDGRTLSEIKALLGGLKVRVSEHEKWVSGLAAGSRTPGLDAGKPVPATSVDLGKKVSPGAGPGGGSVLYPKVESQSTKGFMKFDGVDGESKQGAQAPTGTTVIPKLEMDGKGGLTGYEGVDGESLGQ